MGAEVLAAATGGGGGGAPVTMMVLPPSAKLAIKGAVAGDVEFCDSVVLGKAGARDQGIVVGYVVRSRRRDRFAAKGEAHAPRLGRNRGIDGRSKAHQQARRIARMQFQGKALGGCADKQASPGRVEFGLGCQKFCQQIRGRDQWHIAAPILQDEICRRACNFRRELCPCLFRR